MLEKIFEWTENNPTVANTIFTTIFGIVGFIVGRWTEKKKEKKDKIKTLTEQIFVLKEENVEFKTQSSKISSIEKRLNKSFGTIYIENLDDHKQRNICGFCWEKEHKCIPLPMILKDEYDEQAGAFRYGNVCQICKAYCEILEHATYSQSTKDKFADDELPF